MRFILTVCFLLLCFSRFVFATSYARIQHYTEQKCYYVLKIKSVSDSTLTVEVLDYITGSVRFGIKEDPNKRQFKLCPYNIGDDVIIKKNILDGAYTKKLLKSLKAGTVVESYNYFYSDNSSFKPMWGFSEYRDENIRRLRSMLQTESKHHKSCIYKTKIKSVSDSNVTVEVLDYIYGSISFINNEKCGIVKHLDKKQLNSCPYKIKDNITIKKEKIDDESKELIKDDAVLRTQLFSCGDINKASWRFSKVLFSKSSVKKYKPRKVKTIYNKSCSFKLKIKSISDSNVVVNVLEFLNASASIFRSNSAVRRDHVTKKQLKPWCSSKVNNDITIKKEDISDRGKKLLKIDTMVHGIWSFKDDGGIKNISWDFWEGKSSYTFQTCLYKLKIKSVSSLIVKVDVLDYLIASEKTCKRDIRDGKGFENKCTTKYLSDKEQIKSHCFSHIKNNVIENLNIMRGRELMKAGNVVRGEWSLSGRNKNNKQWDFFQENENSNNKESKKKSIPGH